MKKSHGLSRIAIGICMVAVIFAIFNAFWMNGMKTTAQDMYEHPYTVSNTARQMRSSLLDMKRFMGIFLTTSSEDGVHSRALFEERYKMQNEAIDTIRNRYLGPGEDVARLQYAMDALILIQEEAGRYAAAGHTDPEILRFIEEAVYPCYDEVEAALDTLIHFSDEKILELTQSAAHMATGSTVSAVILTVVIIFLTVYSNIVERKSLQALTAREHELENALLLAEKASKAKKEFLSRMSHEMRTPLNSVLGGVHLAKVKKEKGLDNSAELKLVEESGQFLLNLINDILDVNRIDADKIQLYNQWCRPMDTIQTAVKIVLPMMEAKNIQFIYPQFDLAKETFELYVDPQRMKQVLINLLNNAAKFTPEGGTVMLSVKHLCHDAATATDRITITDTGCGMSQDFISRIGEAFTQEQNCYSGQVSGSGLGLFIVKKILDVMGGTLSVESEVGKGTTFHITIQYQYRLLNDGMKREKITEAPIDLSGLQVLCAEDNIINQAIISELLENEGVKVTMVSDGLQAVETFSQATPNAFDAILMDLMMPVMDGLEATKAIRRLQRPDAKTVPIIAASADAIQENIDRAMALGFTEYLTKPIEPKNLYRMLGKYAKTI